MPGLQWQATEPYQIEVMEESEMSIGDEPAFPVMKSNGQTSEGLTKWEFFVTAAMVGMLASQTETIRFGTYSDLLKESEDVARHMMDRFNDPKIQHR